MSDNFPYAVTRPNRNWFTGSSLTEMDLSEGSERAVVDLRYRFNCAVQPVTNVRGEE